jgi:hypothetical protein
MPHVARPAGAMQLTPQGAYRVKAACRRFLQSAAGAPVAAQTKKAKAAAANPAGAKGGGRAGATGGGRAGATGGGRAGATPDAAKAIAAVDLHREQAEKVRPQ